MRNHVLVCRGVQPVRPLRSRVGIALAALAILILLGGCVANSEPSGISESASAFTSWKYSEGSELARDAREQLFGHDRDAEFGERLLAAALSENPGSLHALETLERLLQQRLQAAMEGSDWEAAQLQIDMLTAAVAGAALTCNSTQQVRAVYALLDTAQGWRSIVNSRKQLACLRWLDTVSGSIANADLEEAAGVEEICGLYLEDVTDPALQDRLNQVSNEAQARVRQLTLTSWQQRYDGLAQRAEQQLTPEAASALHQETLKALDEFLEFSSSAGFSDAETSLKMGLGSLQSELEEMLAAMSLKEAQNAADARGAAALARFEAKWVSVEMKRMDKAVSWQSVLDALALADAELAGVEAGCSHEVLERARANRLRLMDVAAEARAKQIRNYNRWAIDLIADVDSACKNAVDQKSSDEEDEALVEQLSKLGAIDLSLVHTTVLGLYNDVYGRWINEDLPLEKKLEVVRNIVNADKKLLTRF